MVFCLPLGERSSCGRIRPQETLGECSALGRRSATGKCKTEASAKLVPIDEYTAADLLVWYRLTPYREPGDWVFATDSARVGGKRGKQPLWLSKVMQYHIQSLVKRLGVSKRVSWPTFPSAFTSLLTANNENVKVVQELLRHASSKTTLDIYAQARMKDVFGQSLWPVLR